MKKRKSVLAILLATGMLTGMLSGCGNAAPADNEASKAQGNESAQGAESGEKPEISITILERGKCPAEEGTMEDNRWTQWINENSPVKVKWVPVPRTESVAKINALFASGEAPDMVWEFGKPFMENLKAQGVLQPVDEYIEQYSTEYKAYLEEHQELLPYITSEDGLMYGMSAARTPLQVANWGMWIRQDWLDALNLETPQTTDELYEVAKAFTTQDPDGNGQDDTFGIAFNYNFDGTVQTMFGMPSEGVIANEDGTLGDWNNSQGFVDCYNWVRSFYQDGLMDPEYITDTNYEKQRQLFVTGKAGIFLGSWDMKAEWMELKANVPEADLVPLEPVESEYGRFGLYQEPPAMAMICMNKDAENPEACMQFLDWLITDGWFMLKYGVEGEHYNLVDGVPQVIDEDKNIKELSYAGEYAIVANEVIEDMDTYIAVTAAQDELSQEYAALRAQALNTAMKNEFNRQVPYVPSTELSSAYTAEFNEIMKNIKARMITDPEYSVEQGVEDMKAERANLGYDEVMAERQAWYDTAKDSMQ